jgi:hypothetical protein
MIQENHDFGIEDKTSGDKKLEDITENVKEILRKAHFRFQLREAIHFAQYPTNPEPIERPYFPRNRDIGFYQ